MEYHITPPLYSTHTHTWVLLQLGSDACVVPAHGEVAVCCIKVCVLLCPHTPACCASLHTIALYPRKMWVKHHETHPLHPLATPRNLLTHT